MGLEVGVNELITPTLAIKRYFSDRPSGSSVYVVGSELIKEEIKKMGIHVLNHSRETAMGEVFVVLGMSPNLNYEHLQEGFFLLQKGARLILLNSDICCPTESGMYLDTGAIARVYTSAAPRNHIKPEVLGKPSIWMQQKNKEVYLHVDLISGVQAQSIEGMTYIAEVIEPDGIVSTKTQAIDHAKKLGLKTVQRIFLIDSHALNKSIEACLKTKPDAVEAMPALMPRVIKEVKEKLPFPIVAGGLIRDQAEVDAALEEGATAVSGSYNYVFYKKAGVVHEKR